MLDNLKAITRTRFKRTNFNSFLFFFFFAVVIWIFVQFSKVYNEIIEIPVEYVNVPPDKVISPENEQQLQLRMIENGFKIAWFSLITPTLSIDISNLPQEDQRLVYIIDEHRKEIREQLNLNFEDSEFLRDEIYINFEQRQEKRIPVASRIKLSFGAGYAAVDRLGLEPDSVTVSGPDNIIDTLNSVTTVPLVINDVKRDLSGSIAIDTSGLEKVTVYQKRVNYNLDVEKVTEGSLEIPVELINVPEGLNVVIFPKEILVFYQVNLKDFSRVEASDFRVVGDFNDLNQNQNFLIPRIADQPDFVKNLRLNEKKIQFIIKK
ncbi:YbbR-like domain-containing protein [Salinimicrobium sp. GXAS 041]|uniref:YbbR-like domain-containing protein n=1 Tax=Salinimicrobium sp. GXAS 041 TaxID=3400806 RepID=UPI003C77D4C2